MAKQHFIVPLELFVQNEKPCTWQNIQEMSRTLDILLVQQKKLTSSCVIKRLYSTILAKVVHISSAVNIPEAAILPNASQGTTRRNVLLKRGSKANRGASILIMCDGQLKDKTSQQYQAENHTVIQEIENMYRVSIEL